MVPGSLENWLLLRSLRTMDLVGFFYVFFSKSDIDVVLRSASADKLRLAPSWLNG